MTLEQHYQEPHILRLKPKRGGFMPRISWDDLLRFKGEKVILLGKENLEKLRGYKAYVQVDDIHGEILITITGLTRSSKQVFDSLKALKPEEIYSDNPSRREPKNE